MEIRKYNQRDEGQVKNIFAQYWTDPEFLSELSENLNSTSCNFYVADKDGGIVGVAGIRKAPGFISVEADTKNPSELYVIASKRKNEGNGSLLAKKMIEVAKEQGFTEIIGYSPETHSSSWRFYESLGFTQGGIIKDPDDGYPGMLWKKIV
ncbi:MAG: GNAT family N-acetyltransferase [Candidatus Paceibacterota bacterium]